MTVRTVFAAILSALLVMGMLLPVSVGVAAPPTPASPHDLIGAPTPPAGPSWRERLPAYPPEDRMYHSLAFDSARGVTVMFGGGGAAPQDETWEWDGDHWSQRTPIQRPAGRYNYGLAYDSARGVTVLFGGYLSGSGFALDDTWEWDGSAWTQLSPAHRPPARWSHAMAYDSARGVTVLFGGRPDTSTTRLNDTWEWDGSDWTQVFPANQPPARHSHGLAYDSARGVTVLFGGSGETTPSLDDTWEWDGSNWTQISPATRPPGRSGHRLAYDSARGLTVLFGGSAATLLADTWAWNGTDWAAQSPAASPSMRTGYGLAYDSRRGVLVLFGGLGYDPSYSALGDLWELGLAAPILAPIDNTDGDGAYLVDWGDVQDATGYTLEEDDNPAFSSPLLSYAGAGSQYAVFEQGVGRWYYRARAANGAEQSIWSPTRTVDVAPAAPELLPIDNADRNGNYLVDWNAATGATSYTLEQDDDPAFGSPVARYEGAATEFSVSGQVLGVYYYRVRASTLYASGPWSGSQAVAVGWRCYLPVVQRAFTPNP